jgi:hypothetical protein
MTYICIKCQALWVIGEPTAEFSGGLCDDCIVDYVRSKQLKDGFEDCFRRAVEVCDKECKYHELCCRPLIIGASCESQKDYFKHNSCQL